MPKRNSKCPGRGSGRGDKGQGGGAASPESVQGLCSCTPRCRSSTSRGIVPNQNRKEETKNVNSIFSETRKLLNPEPQARQEEGQRQQRQCQRVLAGTGRRRWDARPNGNGEGHGRHATTCTRGSRVPARICLAWRSTGDQTKPGATSKPRTYRAALRGQSPAAGTAPR